MRPDQLGDFRIPSDANLHPDGVRAAFVVTQMNMVADRYDSSIWLLDGDTTRPLTTGESDTSPRWSPSGETLAFLRKGQDEHDKPQLALLPASGGEAEVLTDFPLGVSAISWSPDGTRLLLQATEFVDGHESEDERARAPRRVAHPAFRFDNVGWMSDRRSHLWVFDVATHDSTQLTFGDAYETDGAWSPDGSTIAFISATDERWWVKPLTYVFTVDAGGGQPSRITPRGDWSWVGFDLGGAMHVIGTATDGFVLGCSPLQRIEADGSIVQLTDVDRYLRPGHPPTAAVEPRFLTNGEVHCVMEDRGSQKVIAVAADGSVTDVAAGSRVITGWHPTPDGASALFTASHPTIPGELYRWDAGAESQLTNLNRDFTAEAGLVDAQAFTFDSDGEEIHGWVLLPPGEGKVPLLFNIHGGPAAQYTWGFFDEFQVYVGAGYGVVAVNPRGSSGYGDDHMRVPIGRWADDVPPDQADLMRAPFAAAEQFARLDTDRLGIMGGSYGGLSTVMVTSMDQRYKSAVAERGVYNWMSMAGTSDIPWFIPLYLEAEMPGGALDLWEASPLARAHWITTPTLVVHSETDYRCPVEQAQQLFSLLYQQGVETEMVLFPAGEGHELSRRGKPKHRQERFEAILDWHGRHIDR